MFHRGFRQQALEELRDPFDLVVVGGGISGAGIFFDAALRGLRVLLVEKGDLAIGTSSRSSKLIHGGLRYLKQLQLGVTRTSIKERDRQQRLYPQLVHPLPWVYPSFHDAKTPAWQVEIGLWLYDHLAGSEERYRKIPTEELLSLAPGIRHEDLDKVLVFHDSIVDDARLTFAVAASGFAAGGWVLTRAEPEEALRGPGGDVCGLVLRDLLTEATHRVEASLVVNATGAWVDSLRQRFGLEGRTVRPSRGSHLLFERRAVPVEAAVTVPSPDDGRPVFFIPHPEGVLVGTTDLFHDGSLDDPRPTRAEADYLLRALARTFPECAPGWEDVRGAFAGVRPVITSDVDDPSAASREERIWYEEGLLSVAGGKLTTWRATAEEAVDRALKLLPPERAQEAGRCATKRAPLAGAAPLDLPHRLGEAFGLQQATAEGMARRLGSVAWFAAELAGEGELLPLADGLDLCAAEIRGHLRFGAVLHLSDLLLRRLRLAMWTPAVASDLAPHLRELVCGELGWSGARWEQELEAFH
ncbi:MAG: glycerol-3-phosphate dehydrogenase/oxidase, partial [Acidobacteria bacterium]|nr:glycerol-3-phosphate dehydrogenase/oxidase [Acidobacteriota bacterium]